jgi:menaquinone-9 beta-reductase
MPVGRMRMVFGGKAYGAFPERYVKPLYDETLYFTLRGELEQWILGLSEAELVTDSHVRPADIDWDGRRYTLAVGPKGGAKRVVRCEHLIGAGGTHCPVRRRFFEEDRRREDLVVLQEAEIVSDRHEGEMSNYYFFDGVTGFAWLYPKGHDARLANLGICAVGDPRKTTSIKTHWESFVAHLKREGRLDAGYDAGTASGSALYLAQLDGPVQQNAGTCFIVGDAAGVAHRDFWNGITPSIQSGKLAAEQIAGHGRYRRADLTPFLFRFGRRALPMKARALDFILRRALPRLSRYLEARRPSA